MLLSLISVIFSEQRQKQKVSYNAATYKPR
jgi:hypothetical protein